jgi:hypothetical protein
MEGPPSPTPTQIETFQLLADPKKIFTGSDLTKRLREQDIQRQANLSAQKSRQNRQAAIANRRNEFARLEQEIQESAAKAKPAPKSPSLPPEPKEEVKVPTQDIPPPCAEHFPNFLNEENLKSQAKAATKDVDQNSVRDEQQKNEHLKQERQRQKEVHEDKECKDQEDIKSYWERRGSNVRNAAINNISNAFIGGVSALETFSELINFHLLETKHLGDNFSLALESGEFDLLINEMVSVPWIAELASNSMAGAGMSFLKLVIKTHHQNLAKMQGGYRTNRPNNRPAEPENHRDEAEIKIRDEMRRDYEEKFKQKAEELESRLRREFQNMQRQSAAPCPSPPLVQKESVMAQKESVTPPFVQSVAPGLVVDPVYKTPRPTFATSETYIPPLQNISRIMEPALQAANAFANQKEAVVEAVGEEPNALHF